MILPTIIIENLTKVIDSSQILNDVNINISGAKIVGLAGASGSGKSTLLRIIQGLDDSYNGKLHVNGRTGFMFQDFQLFQHMTVIKNMTWAPKINCVMRNKECDKMRHSLIDKISNIWDSISICGNTKNTKERKEIMKEIDRDANLLLEKLGLLEKKDLYPCQLSGGQKQRLALGRAIMLKPHILLCDEPTSGLDIPVIRNITNLMRAIKKEYNTMIVIASHDLHFLTKTSDRIIFLRSGKIVADIEPHNCPDAIEYLSNLYNSGLQ